MLMVSPFPTLTQLMYSLSPWLKTSFHQLFFLLEKTRHQSAGGMVLCLRLKLVGCIPVQELSFFQSSLAQFLLGKLGPLSFCFLYTVTFMHTQIVEQIKVYTTSVHDTCI